MSILGNIFSRIIGRGRGPASQPPQQSQQPHASPMPPPAPAPQMGAMSQPAQTAAMPRLDDVDVAKLLDDMADRQKQKLDWRRSIVDLMKLLGMDSSLAERKELAKELGYKADTKDSAAMNLWLHQQVLRRLAENGGKVPQDLLH